MKIRNSFVSNSSSSSYIILGFNLKRNKKSELDIRKATKELLNEDKMDISKCVSMLNNANYFTVIQSKNIIIGTLIGTVSTDDYYVSSFDIIPQLVEVEKIRQALNIDSQPRIICGLDLEDGE